MSAGDLAAQVPFSLDRDQINCPCHGSAFRVADGLGGGRSGQTRAADRRGDGLAKERSDWPDAT
jgi:hypothetical protein